VFFTTTGLLETMFKEMVHLDVGSKCGFAPLDKAKLLVKCNSLTQLLGNVVASLPVASLA